MIILKRMRKRKALNIYHLPNHDSLFAIGQLFETDALIFFYDLGGLLENIFFKPEPINLT